jgi:hypothetical protein
MSSIDLEAGWELFEPKKLRDVTDLLSFDDDNDLTVFRKFKWLSVCALLNRQNQLIAMEREVKGCEEKNLPGILHRVWPLIQDYSTYPLPIFAYIEDPNSWLLTL